MSRRMNIFRLPWLPTTWEWSVCWDVELNLPLLPSLKIVSTFVILFSVVFSLSMTILFDWVVNKLKISWKHENAFFLFSLCMVWKDEATTYDGQIHRWNLWRLFMSEMCYERDNWRLCSSPCAKLVFILYSGKGITITIAKSKQILRHTSKIGL